MAWFLSRWRLPLAFVWGEDRPIYRLRGGRLVRAGTAEKHARFVLRGEVDSHGTRSQLFRAVPKTEGARWIVYVTDLGQSQHFAHVFAVAKKAGWVPADTRIDELEAAVRTVGEPNFTRPLNEVSFGELLFKRHANAEIGLDRGQPGHLLRGRFIAGGRMPRRQ